MYQLNDWAAVQKVYKETKSKRATAKILGMSRNTVRKLLAMNERPVYKRNIYRSCIDPYKEQIIAWRCKPYEFNGTRIFKELGKIGYEGSIGPLYRFLRIVDEDTERISSKATVRIETPLGDQAQFDWAEYQMPVGGIRRTVYCFSMILAASRKKAVCFSLREDAEAIYEAIQELFEDLDGVTREILIDNPRALVISNDPKNEMEIQYNPNALLLAKHLGTELNACPYYWPRKKGKIENPFRYIEEQFVKGNEFGTMEELNRRGKQFVDEWCDEPHGTTGRIPNQHYLLEEKQALLPLPGKRLRFKPLQSRIVSADSFVSIKGCKYSVPVKYVNKMVKFRILYGFRIEIYDRNETFVLRLEKSDQKHDVVTDEDHYAAIAVKVSTSVPQIRRDFSARFQHGKEYLEAADRRFQQPTHHARKILLLGELYDDDTLDRFIAYSISQDQLDIRSFKAFLKEYNAGRLRLPDEEDTEIERDNTVREISCQTNDSDLTRDCNYYEENAMTEVGK